VIDLANLNDRRRDGLAVYESIWRGQGSSQYFLTGSQLLARNLRLVRTKEQKNSILSLGGTEVLTATSAAQYAYIPISVWAAPGEDGLGLPLPSDLLAQQIQITITLKPSTSFWLNNPSVGSPVAPPSSFDVGYVQIEQLEFKDRAMALTNRVDMDTHMYTYPLPTFDQQEFVFTGQSGAGSIPLTMSGFRSGAIRKLQVFCVQTSGTSGVFVKNPLYWQRPQAIEVLYMGLKYATYQNGSSAIWNLMDGTSPAAVDQSIVTLNSSTGFNSASGLSEYVELHFAQPTASDYEALVCVHGKEILNGIANLNITLPDGSNTYDVHIVYVYDASVAFTKSSAELVF